MKAKVKDDMSAFAALPQVSYRDDCDRERLKLWLSRVVAGEKTAPLIIVGPQRSGKSTLLYGISNVLNGEDLIAWRAIPRNKEYYIWRKLNNCRCLAIDDCWFSGVAGGKVERLIQEIVDGTVHKVSKSYSTDEVIELKANGALAVATVSQKEEHVLKIKDEYRLFKDVTVVRLVGSNGAV